jgi:hypothetical protein
VGPATANTMDTRRWANDSAYSGERKARQETCVLRCLTSVAVEHSRSCTYRLSTTTCMNRTPTVNASRIEHCGFETAFYS